MYALAFLLPLFMSVYASELIDNREGSIGGGHDSVTDYKTLMSAMDDIVDVM